MTDTRAAARLKVHRQRCKRGLAMLSIEVPLGPWADWLCEAGFLPTWDSEDKAAITAATERLLMTLINAE
jgi:hypothetical protein